MSVKKDRRELWDDIREGTKALNKERVAGEREGGRETTRSMPKPKASAFLRMDGSMCSVAC